jgi:hypothetical protein
VHCAACLIESLHSVLPVAMHIPWVEGLSRPSAAAS